MDFQAATVAIFALALAIGALAYIKSGKYGDKLPTFWREALRVTLGLCVALAVWGCVSYALWIAGVELKIVAIRTGRMHEGWWTGPAALAWAAITFAELRRSTTKR